MQRLPLSPQGVRGPEKRNRHRGVRLPDKYTGEWLVPAMIAFAKSSVLLSPLPPAGGEGQGGQKKFWQRV